MREELIDALRRLDASQTETDITGEREVAWYYIRDEIEDVLGLDRGALDTYSGNGACTCEPEFDGDNVAFVHEIPCPLGGTGA